MDFLNKYEELDFLISQLDSMDNLLSKGVISREEHEELTKGIKLDIRVLLGLVSSRKGILMN